MNIDTGHVVLADELAALKAEQRERYVGVPRHMEEAALSAQAAGDSLFSGTHGGQRVKSQALALARKAKANRRRKIAKASRRRNRQ
jgi:hypothetical protein